MTKAPFLSEGGSLSILIVYVFDSLCCVGLREDVYSLSKRDIIFLVRNIPLAPLFKLFIFP